MKCVLRSKMLADDQSMLALTCIIESATDNTAPCKTSLNKCSGGNIVSWSDAPNLSSP